MRLLFGIVLGALLTVGAAYIHDNWSNSSASASSPAVADGRMVNWDVVDANWRIFRERARGTWTMLSQKVQG
jgi:hypothetical protein